LVAAGNDVFYGVIQNYIYPFSTANNQTSDLFDFSNFNGVDTVATLILDAGGSLIGITYIGGTNSYGTFYKLNTVTNFTNIYLFSTSSGAQSLGSVMHGNVDILYSTTTNDFGVATGGTVFRFLVAPVASIPLNIQSFANVALLTWTHPIFNLQLSTNIA